jgi:peptide/nickel transport system permease protein
MSTNICWRFWISTSGKIGLILTGCLIFLAIAAPVVAPYDAAVDRNYLSRLVSPSVEH